MMANVRLLEMLDIGWCLTIVLLIVSFDDVSGVEFLEKPENVTLDSYEKPYTLNCSIDMATPDGIDWVAVIDGEEYEIFSSLTNVTSRGYSVERPNNRTVNLIIWAANFQNSSVAGRYCCDSENGSGTRTACAYVTVTDVSQSPSTDITKANEVTAATNIATSTDLSTMHNGLSSGVIVAISFGVIVSIAAVIGLVYLYHHCIKRRNQDGVNQRALIPAGQSDIIPTTIGRRTNFEIESRTTNTSRTE